MLSHILLYSLTGKKPPAVHSCKTYNITAYQVTVVCSIVESNSSSNTSSSSASVSSVSSDSNVNTNFIIEVYSAVDESLTDRIISSKEPTFNVRALHANTTYIFTVFSQNKWANSSKISFQVSTGETASLDETKSLSVIRESNNKNDEILSHQVNKVNGHHTPSNSLQVHSRSMLKTESTDKVNPHNSQLDSHNTVVDESHSGNVIVCCLIFSFSFSFSLVSYKMSSLLYSQNIFITSLCQLKRLLSCQVISSRIRLLKRIKVTHIKSRVMHNRATLCASSVHSDTFLFSFFSVSSPKDDCFTIDETWKSCLIDRRRREKKVTVCQTHI